MEDINNIINVAQTLKKKDTQKSDMDYKEKNTEEIKSEQQEQNLIIIDEKQKTDITEQTDEMKETTEERKTQLIEDFKEIRQQDEKELIKEETHEAEERRLMPENAFREWRTDFASIAVSKLECALEKGDTSGQYADVYFAAKAYQAHVVKTDAKDDRLESVLLARLNNAVNAYIGSHKKNPYTKRGKNRRNAVMSVKESLDKIQKSYNDAKNDVIGRMATDAFACSNENLIKEKLPEKEGEATIILDAQKTAYRQEISDMEEEIKIVPVYDKYTTNEKLISWVRASMIIDGATDSYKNIYTALCSEQRSFQKKEDRYEIRNGSLIHMISEYERTHVKPKTQKGRYRLEMCKELRKWAGARLIEYNNKKSDVAFDKLIHAHSGEKNK